MLTTNELQKRFEHVQVTAQEINALDTLTLTVKSWILLLCNNNHATAIFLSQLMYWTEQKLKEGKGEIEIYKTIKEWEEETGLSRYQQEQARRFLRAANILTERRKRTANCMCVVHYTLKVEVLQEYMELVAKQLKNEGKLNRYVIAQEIQKEAKKRAATQPQQLAQPPQRIEQPPPNSMTTERQAIGLTNVRNLLGLLKGSR